MLLFILFLCLVGVAHAQPLPLGMLAHDGPATPEQLSLVLPITAPLPATATATMRYRVQGGPWVDGHPLYRIQPQWALTPGVGTVPDAFAWPIIDLSPGTTYDVEVTVTEGGISELRTLTHTTRALPPASGPATKHLPAGSTQAQIQAMLNTLLPGDVLELADGVYPVSNLNLTKSGTPSQPITIRGQSRQGTVLHAATGRVFYIVPKVDDIVLEHLTLRGSGVDSGVAASSVGIHFYDGVKDVRARWTIRDVTFEGVDRGIMGWRQESFLLYHNTFLGNNTWTPLLLTTNATWNDDAVNVPGTGTAIWENTIAGFGDCMSYAQHSGSSTLTSSVGIHVYRNEMRNCGDDFVEVDHGHRNLTFYDNRVHNTMNFLSLDPLYGGPLLFARNIAINVGRLYMKWNNTNSGMFVYNNTVVRTTTKYAVDSGNPVSSAEAGWYQSNNGPQRGMAYQNNVLVYHGTGTQTLRLDNPGYTAMDFSHNAWWPDRAFKWPERTFTSLAAAQAGISPTAPVFGPETRRHAQDVILPSAQPFTIPVVLGANYLVEVTDTVVPTLLPVIAPGVSIVGVTDGYSGAGPTRGAIIAGRPLVAYGDHPQSPPPCVPACPVCGVGDGCNGMCPVCPPPPVALLITSTTPAQFPAGTTQATISWTTTPASMCRSSLTPSGFDGMPASTQSQGTTHAITLPVRASYNAPLYVACWVQGSPVALLTIPVRVDVVPPPPGDVQAPTMPPSLTATLIMPTTVRVRIGWGVSKDNIEVTAYLVYRDGVLIKTIKKTTKPPTRAYLEYRPAGTYLYEVVAVDAAGNRSPTASIQRVVPTLVAQ